MAVSSGSEIVSSMGRSVIVTDGHAGANGSIIAKPPVIHPIGRGAADRVEHTQIAVGASHASDAEFAGVSGRHFGCTGIRGGDGNSGRRRDDSEAGAGIIKEHDRAPNEKIIGSVVGAKISGGSLELQRAGAGRRNCAAERRAEVAIDIIVGAASGRAGVGGAAQLNRQKMVPALLSQQRLPAAK